MKLKRIELQGFKSFVDRTVLEFDEGITAILGPNGCGKSNVVDAVRWVLGEQSAKTLRGTSMDDVIFKGTTKRKPVGLAEVTLIFDNTERGMPIEYDEVAIKRRVTRDGGSDYFLNSSLCRLKDLRDLFYDSGVNNAAYSIIENKMIDQVLNEHTQELRRLLEEGSGITKYKARRKETQRKLERTHQDLLRLFDIIEEIGREVRSLKYQVGKARRHQTLFNEVRSLDILLADRQWRDMKTYMSERQEQLQGLGVESESETGELAELRTRIEETRPALEEREAERHNLEEALQACIEELQEVERQVLLMEHRIDEQTRRTQSNSASISETEARKEEVARQIFQLGEHLQRTIVELGNAREQLVEKEESLSLLEERLVVDRRTLEQAVQMNLEFVETDANQHGRLRELQVKQENRRERLKVLANEAAEIDGANRQDETRLEELNSGHRDEARARGALLEELAGVEREVNDLEADAAEMGEEISSLVAKREALVGKSDLLRRIRDEYQGYGQGAREILKQHAGEDRISGGLAESIQVPEDYTAGFETLFSDLLDAIVVDGAGTALDLVGELRSQKKGQASFICGDIGDSAAPQDLGAVGGRPAAEVLSGAGLEVPHLKRLLAATRVFSNDDEAVEAAVAHGGPMTLICVSPSGLVVTSDGIVRGGRRQGAEISLLGRGEKLKTITAEIDELEGRVTRRQERRNTCVSRREELRGRLVAGRAELEGIDLRIGELHVEMSRIRSRIDTAASRVGEIEGERTRLESELVKLTEEETELAGVLAESERQRCDSTSRKAELHDAVASTETERDELRAQTEELRLLSNSREGEKRETEVALSHMRENQAELQARIERLTQEIEIGQRENDTMTGELEESRNRLNAGFDEQQRRRNLVAASVEAMQSLRNETDVWRDRVQEIEDRRANCREEIHRLETEVATRDVSLKNLEERISEQYKGEISELVATVDHDHLPRELQMDEGVFQVEQAADLLRVKKDRLGSLGPINHLALDEYETKSERLQFLETQRDDVQRARDDLSAAIDKINSTARKLFSDTFEEVRRNFIAVFQTLFEGGRADLRLIRTDDPLESNVHIIAQPKGKVVDHVSLLSGGERCLTALSLLFAVYLVKPSPYCMLDEVDAPLDDANIGRFVNMLREFSKNTQFLIITHNKLTMETANHLYGVTMMEKGVSSIVSVSFHDVAETQSDAELRQAIARKRRQVDDRESVRAVLADDNDEGGVRFVLDGNDVEETLPDDEPESGQNTMEAGE